MPTIKHAVQAFSNSDFHILEDDINKFITRNEDKDIKIVDVSVCYSNNEHEKLYNAMLAYTFQEVGYFEEPLPFVGGSISK